MTDLIDVADELNECFWHAEGIRLAAEGLSGHEERNAMAHLASDLTDRLRKLREAVDIELVEERETEEEGAENVAAGFELIQRIEAYCRRYRISETTFGGRALNSGNFVARLRAGGSLTLRTLKRLDEFMMEPTGVGRQQSTVEDLNEGERV